MAGLAVRAGHLLAPHYPDGQLFVDLHGHSDHRPLAPGAALDRLLRQLGVPAARIPADTDERIALWRTELAGRRVLVVLDNAGSTAQVSPLVPTGPGCLTLVTSRRRLTGLEAAQPLSLPVLTDDEAVHLLAQIAGDRVWLQPAAAQAVVRRCGGLPLAIRLAGARLAHRPSWTVEDLADRLAGRRVLDELAAEDRTATGVFAMSYAPLHPDQQRVFRLLGLHPGEHFDDHAAAALAGSSFAEAGKALEELVDRHLLEDCGKGRFRYHDLLREYAHQLTLSTDSEADRRAAVERLLDYYLHAAVAATTTIDPSYLKQVALDKHSRPYTAQGAAATGVAWMEIERPNLTAAVRLAFVIGADRYAWQVAQACWPFLYEGSYSDELIETHRYGLAAARRIGDSSVEATMLNYLASGHYGTGDFEGAIERLQQAADLRSSLGDVAGAAASRMNLAELYHQRGAFAYAAALHAEMLEVRHLLGDRSRIANSLCNLGLLQAKLGNYPDANKTLHHSLILSRATGNTSTYSRSLGHLGHVRVRLGRHRHAIRLLMASLREKQAAGNRKGHAEVLSDLGAAYRGLGEFGEALARHREALAEAEATGDRPTECQVRNEYGRTLLTTGDTAGALTQHQAALGVASRIKLKYEHAKALDGVGWCLRDTDLAAARRHWQEALTMYTEMGVPEQRELARHLAHLPSAAAAS